MQLDVTLSDVVVDLLDDRSDVAIRTGPLPDSRLTQRRLGASGLVVVASPDYLRRAGTPEERRPAPAPAPGLQLRPACGCLALHRR